jgi:predicted SprT family Zn-dependent metalloprotease
MNHVSPAALSDANCDPATQEQLRRERFEHVFREITRRCPTCTIRLNRNAKTMLSLRHRRQGGSVVSVHVGLLDHPVAIRDLPDWVASHGRRITQDLRNALQAVWRDQRRAELVREPSVLPPLETIPAPFDLAGMLAQVHSTWFSHLPCPAIRWARSSPQRTLISIRFACYRARPQAMIVVNPRLARPWVARIFAEHVLYHELCHHAQACAPIRGEAPHSRRFRAWETQYPHHELAVAWERVHLERFLGG